MIGLNPQLGRVFTEEEDRVGGPLLAVISDRLWQRVFSRDPNVLGRSVNFGNQPYTDHRGHAAADVLAAHGGRLVSAHAPDGQSSWQTRDNHPGLFGWGRLKNGVTVEKAMAEMKQIAARLSQQYPGFKLRVERNRDAAAGESGGRLSCQPRPVARRGRAGACSSRAQIWPICLRRAARRGRREFAVRAAVGASRWQIIRQLLIESLVLALVGGALGLCLAAWGRDLLVALSPPGVPRFQDLPLNGWVLLFQSGAFICHERALRSLARVAYIARRYSTRS